MRVLVVGGTGFLGSHVTCCLQDGGHEPLVLVRPGTQRSWLADRGIEGIEGDLQSERSLRSALRRVDALIHCAVARASRPRDVAAQRAVNVEGFSALLRAAQDARIRRVVHVSTLGTLGNTRQRRLLVETEHAEASIPRLSFLGTKREAEERALAAAWAGLPLVVVNPALLLGPRLDDAGPQGLARELAADRVRWHPPGGAGACDVEDAARAIVAALERGRAGERYALGGHPVTWRELLAAADIVRGKRKPAREVPQAVLPFVVASTRGFRASWAGDVLHTPGTFALADDEKARSELGATFRPLVDTLRRALGCGEPLEDAPRTGVSR